MKINTHRIVFRPPVGADGLFVQPSYGSANDARAKREMEEHLNRLNFAAHFHYEDPWTRVSPVLTYDPKGNYNCGRCNKLSKTDKCLLIPITVDPTAGSCAHYETECASDREMDVSQIGFTAEDAMYGQAKNGQGFGCHRCPYASKATEADSVGRTSYCGKGDFRVPPNACCALNGAAIVADYEGDTPKKRKGEPVVEHHVKSTTVASRRGYH